MTNSSSDSATPSSSAELTPPAWRRWIAYAAVALMPLSINYERIAGLRKRPLNLSPADTFVPLLAFFMAIDLWQRKPWARVKIPPLSALLWAAVAALSYFWLLGGAEAFSDWATTAANPLLVVTISAWVFANLADDEAEYRRLALILCGSFSVCVLYAFYQYIGPVGKPALTSIWTAREQGGVTNMCLGGWYDNRMLFGAQAAMLVPVSAAFVALDKDPLVKALAGALGALALCVTLAAGGVLGAVAGIVAIAAVCLISKRYLSAVSLLAGVAAFAILLPHLPANRNNLGTLGRGLSLYAKPDPAKDEKRSTPRLRRYQSALDFLASRRDPMNEKSMPNWILGGGAGRYTAKTNAFYDNEFYPQPGAKTDNEAMFDIEQHERDGFGLIEKTGVELGVMGLGALALFYAAWILGAAGASLRGGPSGAQLLALASLGAGVGALVFSVFGMPSQRGTGSGGTLAFFFALSVWLNSRTPKLAE